MVKRKKKTRRLAVALYPSGIEGKGKRKIGVVRTTLTPKQYVRRFYGSSYHFNTEAAIQVQPIPKGKRVKKKKGKLVISK